MNDNGINIRLQELLLDIKKRPGLFLRKESVTLLSAFLDGFLCSIYYENGKKVIVRFLEVSINGWQKNIILSQIMVGAV